MNTLYYGDNLEILRKYIKDESVDLIYLDPPFNSQRAYNVIFPDKTGRLSRAQIQDFFDGKKPELPDTSETLKKAKREVREREKKKNQPKLGLEE
jgi:DNA modification methylase